MPVYRLTKKDVVFEWSNECQRAFDMLKKMISTTLVMISPDWDKIFHVYTDASDIALGSALMQEQIYGYIQSIYYASMALTKIKRNYNTTKREALGMIYVVGKFKHCLLRSTFVFHVDHQALVYIVTRFS